MITLDLKSKMQKMIPIQHNLPNSGTDYTVEIILNPEKTMAQLCFWQIENTEGLEGMLLWLRPWPFNSNKENLNNCMFCHSEKIQMLS